MSDNKFLKKLKGTPTTNSVVEIQDDKNINLFGNVPGSSGGLIGIQDDKTSSALVAKGAQNWTLSEDGLVKTMDDTYTGEFPVNGQGIWIDSSFVFPASSSAVNPIVFTVAKSSKWVLRVCGKNLLSQNSTIALTAIIKIGANELAYVNLDVVRQPNHFVQKFIIDFGDSINDIIKLSGGDKITVQLICNDATASGFIYTGMTTLTLLQRNVDIDAVNAANASLADVVEAVVEEWLIPGQYFSQFLDQIGDGAEGVPVFTRNGASISLSGWFDLSTLTDHQNLILVSREELGAHPASAIATTETDGDVQTSLLGKIRIDKVTAVAATLDVNTDNTSTVSLDLTEQATDTGIKTLNTLALPVASTTGAGVMNIPQVEALNEATANIDLINMRAFSASGIPSSPSQQDLTNAWEQASGLTISSFAPGILLKLNDISNQLLWEYYTDIGQWQQAHISIAISYFTQTSGGLIFGSELVGQVFAEPDGTGSVNGWDELYSMANTAYQWVQDFFSQVYHNNMGGRSMNDAHPISAITGLQTQLTFLGTHNNLAGLSAADAHPIAAITGLSAQLTYLGVHNNMTDRDAADSHPMSAVTGLSALASQVGTNTTAIGNISAVGFSGQWTDILNRPTIPAAQVNSDWNATSGAAQILNKPTIPAAQVNADWNATSGLAQIFNKPTLNFLPLTGGTLTGTLNINVGAGFYGINFSGRTAISDASGIGLILYGSVAAGTSAVVSPSAFYSNTGISLGTSVNPWGQAYITNINGNAMPTATGGTIARLQDFVTPITNLAQDADLTSTIKLNVTKQQYASSTPATSQIALAVASPANAGIMNAAQAQALAEATANIDTINNRNFSASGLSDTPTQSALTNAWQNASGITISTLASGIRIGLFDITNNIEWFYYTDQGVWNKAGSGAGVGYFTNSSGGLIFGSTVKYQVYAENDGTGSINGLDALDAQVATNLSNISVLQAAMPGKQPNITATGATNLLTAPSAAGGQPGTKPIADFATASQGTTADNTASTLASNNTIAKANSALQAADIAGMATQSWVTGRDGNFATAAQGVKADNATPLATYNAFANRAAGFATAAQGAQADTTATALTNNNTIAKANSALQSIPVATPSVLGGIMPDNETLLVDAFGNAVVASPDFTDLQGQIDEINLIMAGLAEQDLSNVSGEIDFVVESSAPGANPWYRLYKSGWVEQGGQVAGSGSVATNTSTQTIPIMFPVTMANNLYFLTGSQVASGTGFHLACVLRDSTTQARLQFTNRSAAAQTFVDSLWEVKGWSGVSPGQILLDTTLSGSRILSIPQDGKYEITLVGAGGGGRARASSTIGNMNGIELSAGGSGSGFVAQLQLTKGQYPITVGAGGVRTQGQGTVSGAGTGGNSSFGNAVAYGGTGGRAPGSGGAGVGGAAPNLGGYAVVGTPTVNSAGAAGQYYNTLASGTPPSRTANGGAGVVSTYGKGGNSSGVGVTTGSFGTLAADVGNNGYIKVVYIGP